MDARDTWLELDLVGRDPDEAATPAAYDKGCLFLLMLEQAVGRERFDRFLMEYFDRFAFQSIDTPAFLAHLQTELLDPAGLTREELLIEAWVHGPGLPDNAPVFPSDAFDRAGRQAADLVAGRPAHDLDTDGWNSHQWVHFVRALPRDLDTARHTEVDNAFGLSGSGNGEILVAWLQLAIDSGYAFESPEVDESLASFLTRQGRLKYLKPLYKSLASTPHGLTRAKQIYATARPGYHPLSTGSIDRILSWP